MDPWSSNSSNPNQSSTANTATNDPFALTAALNTTQTQIKVQCLYDFPGEDEDDLAMVSYICMYVCIINKIEKSKKKNS